MSVEDSRTDYEKLERLSARLVSYYNGDRQAHDHNPAALNGLTAWLAGIKRDYIVNMLNERSPDLDAMLEEMAQSKEKREEPKGTPNLNETFDTIEVFEAGTGSQSCLPSDDFFFSIGFLAYSKQEDILAFEDVHDGLEAMVGDKQFRAVCPPIYFSWCLLLLEKQNYAYDPECTSEDYFECAETLLDAVYFYLYERTDCVPSQMLMGNALRIMRAASKVAQRPKFWPSYLRIFVTRCVRTREIPYEIQETCYKLTCQAAWMLGPRFWTNDEQFVRTLAAMCAVHWRLMLEGLAKREPLVTAYSLFLEIFLVCEERNRISDQTAIIVASNCKQLLESIAGYVKGEAQNPQPLGDSQRYIVTALMSTLVSTGAFKMIHDDDANIIVDWWLKHSQDQSDVFRQLMLCSTFVKKLDTRVMSALAAYYERCVTGDVPQEEADMMVFHWVVKLIKEERTDFYDRASLSDCVARLERVRTPKKYVDALKKLKC